MAKTGIAAKAAAVVCACAVAPILLSQQAFAAGNPLVAAPARFAPPPNTPAAPQPPKPPKPPVKVTSVKAWQRADVYSGPTSKSKILSYVTPGAQYPALCWTTGEKKTMYKPPITNDHWVMLTLNKGGVGFVWGGALKGNQTGNVPNKCPAAS